MAPSNTPPNKPAQRVTLTAINAAIRAAGGAEELVRGHEYFYFSGGDAARWPQSGVYSKHLSAFTVDGWVRQWRSLREAAR